MKRFVTTMLLALAPAAMSWAQGAPQPGNQPGRQAPGQLAPGQQTPGQPGQIRGQGGMDLSRHLATGLLLENQEEVALREIREGARQE